MHYSVMVSIIYAYFKYTKQVKTYWNILIWPISNYGHISLPLSFVTQVKLSSWTATLECLGFLFFFTSFFNAVCVLQVLLPQLPSVPIVFRHSALLCSNGTVTVQQPRVCPETASALINTAQYRFHILSWLHQQILHVSNSSFYNLSAACCCSSWHW